MNTTSRILGAQKVRPPTKDELTEPYWALLYAEYVIRGRWPEAEPVIATDPMSAYYYSKSVLKGRWPEGEPAIAKDPDYSILYLELFPQAKLEWAMNGWIDWLDL
jgi:hypothetical protein